MAQAVRICLLFEVFQLKFRDDGYVARVLLGNNVSEVLQAPTRRISMATL